MSEAVSYKCTAYDLYKIIFSKFLQWPPASPFIIIYHLLLTSFFFFFSRRDDFENQSLYIEWLKKYEDSHMGKYR